MSAPRRILLIAPGPTLRDELARHLDLEGVEFEVASGGLDAVRRLRRRSFGAAVTSPDTSVEDDLELVEEMRLVRRKLSIVILAPKATPEDVIAALRAQVFACFTVPVDVNELASMLKRGLETADPREGIDVITAEPEWISLRVSCNPPTAERVVQYFEELRADVPNPEREALLTAFREILLNAMEHGAQFDPDKMVEVTAIRTARAIVFYVRDPGHGFRRDALPHAAVSNPPDDPIAHMGVRAEQGLRPGGFGLLVAKNVVNELIYNEQGNEVLLIKHTN
jgi:DNA-binding response OmpR family regulator